MAKKIVLIIALIVVLVGVGIVAYIASNGKQEVKTSTVTTAERKTEVGKEASKQEETINPYANIVSNMTQADKSSKLVATQRDRSSKEVTETKLENGTEYKIADITPEIVLKDKLFDTSIADISINFEKYVGKTISLEGLYFMNGGYTFVGRYSTNSLCPTCPAGISYMEYEWDGDKNFDLKDEDSWIRIVGTLRVGNDGEDYYYIEASSISLMNEKGLTKVDN